MKDSIAGNLRGMLNAAVAEARAKGELQAGDATMAVPSIPLEIPKESAKGDYATPLAMNLASRERRPPREVAEILVRYLQGAGGPLAPDLERLEIAGPGYINFIFSNALWWRSLRSIVQAGETCGNVDVGGGKSVQVEFVSANPTGPLHVGHGRGAALGDTLANLLAAAGYRVHREYYINDVGRQMETLGRSTAIRYRQILGDTVSFPEECYQGGYIKDIAHEILEHSGDRFRASADGEDLPFFIRYTKDKILGGIRDDLKDFGVVFDQWFSEKDLYDHGEVQESLDLLKRRGHLYEQEGAQWLATMAFGDDKDRVVVRSNGQTTYFASDIAYHQDKIRRGFEKIIDIWGADHHGYEPRLRAVIQCLGHPAASLEILLVQLVTLLREGKPVSMSTRSGEFVTLREVMDEVGRDAARFNFLTRRADSPLDFDLELAKRQSQDNPVYYVQYAHARIASLFRQAAERDISLSFLETGEMEADVSLLKLPEELSILKRLAHYADVVRDSALTLEPHRLTFYLLDLSGAIHPYYFQHRIITDDRSLTRARLTMMKGAQGVLRHALGILGVSAPERM